MILRHLQEGIVDDLRDGSKYDVKITYIDQPDPKGIAHAVLISRGFLGESPFVVHLGDNLLKDSVPQLARPAQAAPGGVQRPDVRFLHPDVRPTGARTPVSGLRRIRHPARTRP